MSYMFDWTPDEWKKFSDDYNRRLKRVLASEDLYAKFGVVVAEQCAVIEEAGGNPEFVHTVENYRQIILRTDFV